MKQYAHKTLKQFEMVAWHSQDEAEETISHQLDIDLHVFEVVDWLPHPLSDHCGHFCGWLVSELDAHADHLMHPKCFDTNASCSPSCL